LSATNQASAQAFEHEKRDTENKFREREIVVKENEQRRQERELALKQDEAARSRWFNPLVLAILAATIAASGNAAVVWLTGKTTLALEESKAEAARILEVIKTGDPDKAAKNLEFLVEAGLITEQNRRIQLREYLQKRKPGEGPQLPLAERLRLPVAETFEEAQTAKILEYLSCDLPATITIKDAVDKVGEALKSLFPGQASVQVYPGPDRFGQGTYALDVMSPTKASALLPDYSETSMIMMSLSQDNEKRKILLNGAIHSIVSHANEPFRAMPAVQRAAIRDQIAKHLTDNLTKLLGEQVECRNRA
jgi:hypothetical protein